MVTTFQLSLCPVSQNRFIRYFIGLCLTLVSFSALGQNTIKGQILDRSTGETLFGASVQIKGTTIGGQTDFDGKFEFTTDRSYPITLVVNYMGYQPYEQEVKSADDKLKFKLISKDYQLKAVEVTETRISEKQQESPLTMESMDVIAVRETPAANFYEGLGSMKGVDLTSASIGFKVINTRGFNSTSPVRSLQLIDGVDNQAPGLNFSLGNFLGTAELDVMKVDLIQGASSAFYGPNAFNGVISMNTKDPFMFPGLTVSAKVGERNLVETGIRWAKVWTNKDSVEKLGFKMNFYFMRANDWEAENADPVFDTETGLDNPGGYDAVNRYGDEIPIYFNSENLQVQQPGLGIIYRKGYWEKDIVDYNTENIKANMGWYYKVREDQQLILSSSFGTGTTVYQGDNRYSLKDILFFQNRLEFKAEKGFIRAYATHEDAGKSYDAVFTSLLLQNMAKDDGRWAADYFSYWNDYFRPQVESLPGFPSPWLDPGPPATLVFSFDSANAVLADNLDDLFNWHAMASDSADLGVSPGGVTFNDNIDRLIPGTPEFEAAFNEITSKETFAEGGSRFWDRSALYHIQGEQRFDLDSTASVPELGIIVGGSYRLYTPNSRGTIFRDTTERFTNSEFGVYVGLEKWVLDEQLKVNVTTRVDKNQNFPYVASPAASLVYKVDDNTVVRGSYSAAIRNPTLQDQYLYYNAGRAFLVGNLTGYDSLVTITSARNLASTQNPDTLNFFDVAPLVPEKVRTVEAGVRTTVFERLYIDANYYFSSYVDFLGFNIGVDATIDENTNLFNPSKTRVLRVAANSTDVVTTQGFTIGLNYYFKKFFTLNGNYSWNKLDRKGSEDPIIPAFNTPEHKFNVGFSGREIDHYFKLSKKEEARTFGIHNFGFSANYKWVESFLFEGSPQFTGIVPSYDMLDVQINQYFPKIKTTVKIGASNMLNKMNFQVYGGPRVGRLAYVSLLVEPDRKH